MELHYQTSPFDLLYGCLLFWLGDRNWLTNCVTTVFSFDKPTQLGWSFYVSQAARNGRNLVSDTIGAFYTENAELFLDAPLAGWRLYVTNAPKQRLTLEQAVSYYREQWQPERGFHLFKRGRLPALPIYFQDEARIRGLMFLLTLARRLFTLMEFVVRRQLADQQESLAGLYDGNQ